MIPRILIGAILLLFVFKLGFSQYAPDYSLPVKGINSIEKKYAWAGGLNNPQFSAIDLNNDGIKDLLVFDRTGNKVYTFLNHGTPGLLDYTYDPEFENDFPHLENWTLALDYNCDGIEDLFTYSFLLSSGATGIRVFRGYYNCSNHIQFSIADSLLVYPFQGNMLNLFVSSVDIPAMVDVNNDGDIDILTFQSTGGYVMYFENQSQEGGYGCDSLIYEKYDDCWGDFFESGFRKQDSLSVPCPYHKGQQQNNNSLHAGSTLLSLDNTGDGVKELIKGDISFTNIVYMINGGSADNAHMVSEDTIYPSYDRPADVFIFPAPFAADMNNDGLKDFLVAPNSQGGSENYKCAWYYQNQGNTASANFHFLSDTFLVGDMIDVGEGAYPIFFDADNDGLKDLMIGNRGYFNNGNSQAPYLGKISYYKNIGDPTHPSFQLITKDFANISSLFVSGVYPAFGDLDNDGDDDMLLGEEDGTLLYFENTTSPGSAANFVFMQAKYAAIDVGQFSTPQLVDVNRDGKLDLLIGEQSGNIDYFENTGILQIPSFQLITTSLGNVDVRPYYTYGQSITGYSVPFLIDLKDGNGYTLFVGAENGHIYKYANIDNNLAGTFDKRDTIFAGISEGSRLAISGGDIDQDGQADLVIGNYRGGVTYYDMHTTQLTDVFSSNSYKLYPNPTTGFITIESHAFKNNGNCEVSLVDMMGKQKMIVNENFSKGTLRLFLPPLPAGIYFLHIKNEQSESVQKIVINR
ncbi:MAG: T9SS type A sorting domain-containing protein [Chitinophagales bacterium]|nr:T9SS type A sorting domain-containing protein [Chitinophagales bacterium]